MVCCDVAAQVWQETVICVACPGPTGWPQCITRSAHSRLPLPTAEQHLARKQGGGPSAGHGALNLRTNDKHMHDA